MVLCSQNNLANIRQYKCSQVAQNHYKTILNHPCVLISKRLWGLQSVYCGWLWYGVWCSRNQLSMMPPFISRLELLQVLLVSNNKLVSLPEEIGRLKHLMQLVSRLVFLPRDAIHSTDYAITRCQSVCSSVTHPYSVKTAKHIFSLFSLFGSHILVFLYSLRLKSTYNGLVH